MSDPLFDVGEVFDEDYLYFCEPRLAEIGDADAELIWRLLELEPGMKVLDLACGHGRIANRLAEKGIRVTGLDATPIFLERTRRDVAALGVDVEYVEPNDYDRAPVTALKGSAMAIERSKRPMAAKRMTAIAHELLEASTLCAIATVARGGHAHINTAYFAWSPQLDLVWMSEPRAKHSANIRANNSVAIAIYDSNQSWGKPDRGIQLFGIARKAEGATADDAAAVYAERFPDYRQRELSAYHVYVFRPRRVKIFDERALGTGVFVTASITGKRQLAWERTEIYHSAA